MLDHLYHSPTSPAVVRASSSNDTAHVFCYKEKYMKTAKTEQSKTKKNAFRFVSVLFQFMFSKIRKQGFFFSFLFFFQRHFPGNSVAYQDSSGFKRSSLSCSQKRYCSFLTVSAFGNVLLLQRLAPCRTSQPFLHTSQNVMSTELRGSFAHAQ